MRTFFWTLVILFILIAAQTHAFDSNRLVRSSQGIHYLVTQFGVAESMICPVRVEIWTGYQYPALIVRTPNGKFEAVDYGRFELRDGTCLAIHDIGQNLLLWSTVSEDFCSYNTYLSSVEIYDANYIPLWTENDYVICQSL